MVRKEAVVDQLGRLKMSKNPGEAALGQFFSTFGGSLAGSVLVIALPKSNCSMATDFFRHQGRFGEIFISAISRAGATPNSFLPEYAPRQYEVTVAPQLNLRAADEAVIVREMARAVAFRLGHRVILSPIVELGAVGNGTHIHFSLRDLAGQAVMYDASLVDSRAAPGISGPR